MANGMQPNEAIWIVIVNYRTAGLTIDCLRSLVPQIPALSGGQVVVADNDSGDGSVEKISSAIEVELWQDWARVIPLPRNGGFAYGNNAGISEALNAGAGYVMLLNPDTIAHPGALVALRDFASRRPRAGIVGSLLENPDGGIDCSAHRLHTPLGELEGGARLGPLSRLLKNYRVSEPPRSETHQCDWVSGASMLIRRQVLEQVGLMDEGFFLYFEEVDFCWRARRDGWEVWYLPASRVMHLEGASTGIRAAAQRRASYWYDSRRRFFVKHHGVAGLALADILWSLGRTTLALRRALGFGGGSGIEDPSYFAFDLLWGDLSALFLGRLWSIPRGAGSQP